MRIVITGCKGQLGTALQEVLAGETLLGLALPEHDITDAQRIAQTIGRFEPEVVIHAAAMTDVDGCARYPEAAYRVNALGTQNIALACQQCGAAMVYISTNEVFDGRKDSPYLEFDLPNPINPYGRSKLAGEWYVQNLLERFYLVRTAWMYAQGGHNFVTKILQLAQERGELAVVTDEIGTPTYAPDLAMALARLIRRPHYGIYHLTNEGSCSRYEWAREILTLAGLEVPLRPITLAEYQRASTPPPYGVLRNFCAATALGIRLRPWQEALREYFEHE